MTMAHASNAPEAIVLIFSVNTESVILKSSHFPIVSTPEGCRISRDEEIGFTGVCGNENRGQRRFPILPAAYAICQQLMPRKLAAVSPGSWLKSCRFANLGA